MLWINLIYILITSYYFEVALVFPFLAHREEEACMGFDIIRPGL